MLQRLLFLQTILSLSIVVQSARATDGIEMVCLFSPQTGTVHGITQKPDSAELVPTTRESLLSEAREFLESGHIEAAIAKLRVALVRFPETQGVIDEAHRLVSQYHLGYEVLSSTSETMPVFWGYRRGIPKGEWTLNSHNLEGWDHGAAPFGSLKGQRSLHSRGNFEVALRRSFEATRIPQGRIILRLRIDDSACVLLNGVELIQIKNWHTFRDCYVEIDCSREAKGALRLGENVLAVHYQNQSGASIIDAGLYVLQEDVWGDLLNHAISLKPDSVSLLTARTLKHVREERYLEAGLGYARIASLSRSPARETLNSAALLALSGDRAAYQVFCESQMARLSEIEQEEFPEALARSCLLMPAAINPDRLPIEIVDLRLRQTDEGTSLFGQRGGTLTLAAMRSGRLNQARLKLLLVENSGLRPSPQLDSLLSPLSALLDQHRPSDKENRWAIQTALQQTQTALEELGLQRHPDGSIVGCSLVTDCGHLNYSAITGEILRREALQMKDDAGTR